MNGIGMMRIVSISMSLFCRVLTVKRLTGSYDESLQHYDVITLYSFHVELTNIKQ